MRGDQGAVHVCPENAGNTTLGCCDVQHRLGCLLLDILLVPGNMNHGRRAHERIRGEGHQALADAEADSTAGLAHLELKKLLACLQVPDAHSLVG